MTSRTAAKAAVYNFLGGFLHASQPEELGFDGYDEMSEADQDRIQGAIEDVAAELHRKGNRK